MDLHTFGGEFFLDSEVLACFGQQVITKHDGLFKTGRHSRLLDEVVNGSNVGIIIGIKEKGDADSIPSLACRRPQDPMRCRHVHVIGPSCQHVPQIAYETARNGIYHDPFIITFLMVFIMARIMASTPFTGIWFWVEFAVYLSHHHRVSW